MNIMDNALPPTDVGVIAEVNSHNIVTFVADFHDRRLSDSVRKRHAKPKSRPKSASNAKERPNTACGVNRISFRALMSNSRPKSHITTPIPIVTGMMILSISLLRLPNTIVDLISMTLISETECCQYFSCSGNRIWCINNLFRQGKSADTCLFQLLQTGFVNCGTLHYNMDVEFLLANF